LVCCVDVDMLMALYVKIKTPCLARGFIKIS
jgi:hypothetical protein